ncbi:hypothetical protein N7E81_07590 [Reichenbachiella carrageenanivorans]|uniref:Uncharacterized protein n=1 Tax=Reichenbachiella carrageenanivorans TaxID=2979869 RepID=A0ABY6D577_9BACT|nr:hypothetical protein [Reichenbachiella carrageenanivorans]UXX80959.1 hypothetical protein N7E81_07590 [Reichenbachiella carrageenanivorans]
MKILEVLNEFRFSCSSCKLEVFGGELINDTLYLKNSDIGKPDGLLQRFNPRFFKNIKLLMQNIHTAMDYFLAFDKHVFDTVNLVITKEGNSQFYIDSDGYYWRMYQLMSRRELYKVQSKEERAYDWASAFGKFISNIDELPIQSFVEIDPVDLLQETAINKKEPREIKNEIDYVLRLTRQLSVMNKILKEEECLSSTIVREAARLDRKQLSVLNRASTCSNIDLKINRSQFLIY